MMQFSHLVKQPAFVPLVGALATLIAFVVLVSSGIRSSETPTANPASPAMNTPVTQARISPIARSTEMRMVRGAGKVADITSVGDRGFVITVREGSGPGVQLLADATTRVVAPAGATNVVVPVTDLAVGQQVEYQLSPGERLHRRAHLGRVTVIIPDSARLAANEGIA